MSLHEQVQSASAVLREVGALQAAAAEQQAARLAQFDAEVERLQRNIENLQAQIATLREARRQAEEDSVGDDASWRVESSARLFAALRSQAGALTERTVAWVEAARAVEAQRAEQLKSPEIAPLMEEYEQFQRDVAPTLDKLPPSYRQVIESHHAELAARLQERLDAIQVGPPTVDAEPLHLEVIFACDQEILMVLCPVHDEVHSRWTERDADLQARVATTVVQAMYTALRGTALESSEAAFGGHEGLLAMEVELTPEVGAFGPRLQQAMEQCVAAATDIDAAKVRLELIEVPVDLLIPDADEEEDDA